MSLEDDIKTLERKLSETQAELEDTKLALRIAEATVESMTNRAKELLGILTAVEQAMRGWRQS